MKTRALALRVALNSALMIFVVYLAMQVVVYLRDQAIFGAQSWSDFFPAVFGFIGASVLPPLVVFAVFLWWMALPIERAARRLEAGIVLTEAEAEKTRRNILRFRTIVLAVNLIGFTVGFLIDLIVSGKLGDLVHVHRLSILLSNLCGAFVFAAAQTSLNNVAFAPVRDRLGITSLGDRKRQTSTTTRQLRLTVAMVLYAFLVLQYNQHDLTSFQSWGDQIQAQVVVGTLPADQATAAYRTLVAEKMPTIFSRDPALAASLVPPWESPAPATSVQETVFLLVGALMALIALGVQAAVSREHRESISTLQARIRDVVAGGGDLRKRLALREMDDQGELADLVNRLLDLFQTIVGRIGAAASQTKDGARALETVLSRAEDVSAQVGSSVAILKAELEDQASQSRVLTDALGAFRDAAAAVDAEAGTQGRYVSETSSAMEEMAASIEGVRQKSREAGALTEALARQGEGGGQAVRETGEAIEAIHRSSIEVLQVLGSLKKIAADTNLLAMNAAIEAAHAGEKGAGFAVVADEVRSLATNAQVQTKTIKDLIQAMAREVDAGVARSRAAGQVLSDLVQGLQDSAQVSGAVAEAMEEQAARTRSVGESLTQVVRTSDTIRQKMATQSQTTDAMSGTLGRAIERLSALVETSQIQVQAVAGLEASFAEVRTEVDRNAAAAETLQAEVGRFQV